MYYLFKLLISITTIYSNYYLVFLLFELDKSISNLDICVKIVPDIWRFFTFVWSLERRLVCIHVPIHRTAKSDPSAFIVTISGLFSQSTVKVSVVHEERTGSINFTRRSWVTRSLVPRCYHEDQLVCLAFSCHHLTYINFSFFFFTTSALSISKYLFDDLYPPIRQISRIIFILLYKWIQTFEIQRY